MTLFAGAFRCAGRLELSARQISGVCQMLSRDHGDALLTSITPGAFLVKADIGAFGEPAVVDDDFAVTMVTGEPLIGRGSAKPRGRDVDVSILHEELRAGQLHSVRRARGTFSLAHYDKSRHRLTLLTDRLGMRPVYWWSDSETVVFSSTLRLLESLTWVVKDVDTRGLSELIAFGFPLGSRTGYSNIRMLGAAEIVEWGPSGITSSEYWRWQETKVSVDDSANVSKQAYDAFTDGIRLRQREDRHTTAFLTGGLDSRCVVAALRADGVGVHSFNFFVRHDAEDRAYALELASAAETDHEDCLVQEQGEYRWSELVGGARRQSTRASKDRVERPRLFWSGDGGSVGLGHVYMRHEIVERCIAEDRDGAAAAYVAAEHANIPRHLLQPHIADAMATAPVEGVREELIRLRSGSLLQSFYLMLMQNDQRRHLHAHFENIDQHRVELQLPFFDADFLGVIASVPVNARLYHRFYNAWLANFPAYVSKTPWQAYAGHEPCSIPKPTALAYQWDPAVVASQRARTRLDTAKIAAATLMQRNFARKLMRRNALGIAALLHSTGIRNLDYVIYAARTIQHHWAVSHPR